MIILSDKEFARLRDSVLKTEHLLIVALNDLDAAQLTLEKLQKENKMLHASLQAVVQQQVPQNAPLN